MVMAADLSERHHWIEPSVKQRTIDLLQKAGLPVKSPGEMTIQKYMDGMAIDKKVDRGVIKFILLKQLGKAVITSDYDPDLLKQTLQEG